MIEKYKSFYKIINTKEYDEFFNSLSNFMTNNAEPTLRALRKNTKERYDIIASILIKRITDAFWILEEDLEIEEEREESNV